MLQSFLTSNANITVPVRTGLTIWVFDSHKIFKIENANQLDNGTYTFRVSTDDFDFVLKHRDILPIQLSESDMFLRRRHASSKMSSDILMGHQIQLRICEDEQVAIDRFRQQPSVKEGITPSVKSLYTPADWKCKPM